MRKVFLFGAIGAEVFDTEIINQLDLANPDPIALHINSLGGDVFQGNAIANSVRAYPGTVTAHIEGVCASMATIIALRCAHVVIAEGGVFMIHDPRMTVFDADPSQMSARAELAARIQTDMAAIYASKTGLEESRVLEMMAAETWMSAQEALDLGFVDEIASEAGMGRAAMAASASRFRFNNAPKSLTEFFTMKTKLAAFLQTLFTRAVTDQQPIDALIERIVAAAGDDRSLIQGIIDGMTTITPTDKHLQAFGQVLGVSFEELKAEAAKDFSAHKPRQRVQHGGAAGDNAGNGNGVVGIAEGAAEGVKRERERVVNIRAAFAGFPAHLDLCGQCIDQGIAEDRARQMLLEAIGRNTTAVGGAYVVQDVADKVSAGVTIALMARSDPNYRRQHRHELERNEFTGLTLVEIARHCLRVKGMGHKATGDTMRVVGAAFTSSDFSNILEDIANKSLHQGWEEAEETWRSWVEIADMADFKQHSFTNLSEFDDLLEVKEGGEYKDGEFTDQAEKATLVTWGRIFSISRQAIINDDMNAFTQIPRRMGRAANRKIGDLVYGVLTANAAMADGVALFHADHNNLRASGGAGPATAQFDYMRVQMALQTGPQGKTLGIRPKYALVPVSLEGAAQVVVTAESQVDTAAKNSRIPNSARGMVEVIADHRLDTDDPLQYYFVANPATNPTVVAGFLNGDPTPRVEQQEGWRVDGTEFKVSIDAVSKAIDFRGLYVNPGQ